ncbi:MAG TPA: prolipoprotein diacylglyceryl transferase [Vicinamibacterales bacterium]|nr:prolipoprotein diacylglyceryl transferase [Vicinamibacterales bacterium]
MHPVLFHLPFGVPIYAYGTMLCLSVIIGRLLAVHLASRAGMNPALIDRCVLWTLAGAAIGARLLFVVTAPEQIERLSDAFLFWKGGVVAYGGFLGGFLATIVFCRAHRIHMLTWADCAAPSLCVGLMVTRIGCFLGGCDFGQPWAGAWAVRFPGGSPAFQEQSLLGLLPAGATQSLAVHPTQLYESLAGLVLLIVALAVRRRHAAPGRVFLSTVLGYAVLRAAIEVLRADPHRGSVGPFSTSQFIALVTFALAAAALAWTRGNARPAARPFRTLNA